MRVSSDDRCRVQSRELFKPNARYEGEIAPDGSVRLVELVEKDVPLVKTRKEGGFVLVNAKLDRTAIRTAIRADRDSRFTPLLPRNRKPRRLSPWTKTTSMI